MIALLPEPPSSVISFPYGSILREVRIATAAGLFILLNPWALLVALLVFLSVVIISRYVSLGSVLAASGLALFSIGQCILRALDIPLLILTLALVAIVIIKHIPNLKRLKNKEENKISFSKKGSR